MLTLAVIKAEQDRVNRLIAAYEAQPIKWEKPVEVSMPTLHEGEKWAGVIIGADGRREHIILLPGEKTGVNLAAAKAWAAEQGGELPDRVEGALLFAVMPEEFAKEWHWTREQHAAYADYAWFQYFGYGLQHYSHKVNKLRARAVRRLPI